jgi:hypothetical protein
MRSFTELRDWLSERYIHASRQDQKPPPSLEDAGATGVLLLRSLSAQRNWIHRRVETITFRSDASVSNSIQLDITVPDDTAKMSVHGRPAVLLPLTLLSKDSDPAIRVRGENDELVPALTYTETSALVTSSLVAVAELLLDSPLDGQYRAELKFIAQTRQVDDALKRIDALSR